MMIGKQWKTPAAKSSQTQLPTATTAIHAGAIVQEHGDDVGATRHGSTVQGSEPPAVLELQEVRMCPDHLQQHMARKLQVTGPLKDTSSYMATNLKSDQSPP